MNRLGATLVVRSYVDRVVKPLFAKRSNPFNLEPGREDDGLQTKQTRKRINSEGELIRPGNRS